MRTEHLAQSTLRCCGGSCGRNCHPLSTLADVTEHIHKTASLVFAHALLSRVFQPWLLMRRHCKACQRLRNAASTSSERCTRSRQVYLALNWRRVSEVLLPFGPIGPSSNGLARDNRPSCCCIRYASHRNFIGKLATSRRCRVQNGVLCHRDVETILFQPCLCKKLLLETRLCHAKVDKSCLCSQLRFEVRICQFCLEIQPAHQMM